MSPCDDGEPTLSSPSARSSSTPPPPPQLQQHQIQIHIPDDDDDDDDDDEAEATHPVVKMLEKQELGKAMGVLAVPMGMALFTARDSSFGKTTEMSVVAVALCLAFATIWNGILLRKIYPTAATLIEILGILFMSIAFYVLSGYMLPIHLKWISLASLILSIFPFLTVFIAFICSRNNKTKEGHKF